MQPGGFFLRVAPVQEFFSKVPGVHFTSHKVVSASVVGSCYVSCFIREPLVCPLRIDEPLLNMKGGQGFKDRSIRFLRRPFSLTSHLKVSMETRQKLNSRLLYTFSHVRLRSLTQPLADNFNGEPFGGEHSCPTSTFEVVP